MADARRVAVGIRVLTAVVAVLIAAAMIAVAVSTSEEGEGTTVLVGTLDSPQIVAVLILVGVIDLTVLVFSLRATRVAGRVGVIVARVAATGAVLVAGAGVFLATFPTTIVSPLIDDDGCDTGYLVREENHWLSSSSSLYRMDGLVATGVATISNADGGMPFHERAYGASEEDGTLRVSAASAGSGVVETVTVPELTGHVPECGLKRPTYQADRPSPTPTAPAPVSLERAEAELERMYAATLAAVPGAVGTDGRAVASSAPTRTTCDRGAAQSALTFAFATEDNAASLEKILATWDAAGYEVDRAIQTDIRFDPITTVTLRIADRSTIDGTIHGTITSGCLSEQENIR
ncbi:hypothetical protein [Microbacterium sp. 11MF]|uniref:hypothetical protein n=1 Tax=Microbacterium sp. 11MF TaxID=1169146 RepID=UPI0003A8D345|nr:hypothetical protein [Microbacterium sp. 11MF]